MARDQYLSKKRHIDFHIYKKLKQCLQIYHRKSKCKSRKQIANSILNMRLKKTKNIGHNKRQQVKTRYFSKHRRPQISFCQSKR